MYAISVRRPARLQKVGRTVPSPSPKSKERRHPLRRLLRKERQADGKVKRYHESRAATPFARLLAREDISAEQRH